MLAALALVLPLALRAEEGGGELSPDQPPALWFPVGEQLVYKLYWGWIPVGKTRVITRWVQEDGRRLLAIRYRTRSNAVIAKLYPVDDIIESVIDPETFLPVRFIKNLKEGRHRYHEVTHFDHAAGKAHWYSIRKKKHKTYDINGDTRDLVSFMYFMRAQQFEIGSETKYQVMADEKLYELIVNVDESETIKLPGFKKVPCLKVEPKAKFNGLFVRKGKMTLWVSEGERMLCTRMAAKVPLANVKAILTEVHGPGDDFWIRKTRRILKKRGDDADEEVEEALKELDAERPESLEVPDTAAGIPVP